MPRLSNLTDFFNPTLDFSSPAHCSRLTRKSIGCRNWNTIMGIYYFKIPSFSSSNRCHFKFLRSEIYKHCDLI